MRDLKDGQDAASAKLDVIQQSLEEIKQQLSDVCPPEGWQVTSKYPGTWEMSESGVPLEGLIKLTPSDAEYWKVFEQLRAPTECGFGQMTDAWLSQVCRIQNPQLFHYYQFRKEHLEETGSPHLVSLSIVSNLPT